VHHDPAAPREGQIDRYSTERGQMSTTPLRLRAADISAPPVPSERRQRYRRFGYVSDLTTSVLAHRANERWGRRPAIVVEDDVALTYRDLLRFVEEAAGWLSQAGVGAGDVVCWQTPNWWEGHILGLAIWHVGAVRCPIAPFYREHELREAIGQVRPAAVITAASFRNFAHAEAFDDLLADAGLGSVPKIILRGSRRGWAPFDEVVSSPRAREAAWIAPHEPVLVLFTAGTTSPAKAVVHSSETLLAETRQLADAWELNWRDVAYMPAPLQHITGVLNAMTIPLLVGACTMLAERWDADQAVRDIVRHQVTYSAGATIFLQELTEAAARAGTRLPLRSYACGGASVPRTVMERSEEQGIPAMRVYGMTELPTVTVMNSAAPFELRADTDGALAPGVEARVVGEDGTPLPTGTQGELCVRGPERMLGYLDAQANRAAIDDDGWFRTGDVGVIHDGLISITGRLRDVINRGGEKFSARDIEDVLLTHPSVRQAAIVARPDHRFGEVPVAFVVCDAAAMPDGAELAAHLHARGVARQKTPVAWHFRDALPMTPSGKFKKFELIAHVEAEITG
jgi:acyl-CoA synthetase (AMP-forming)/AMP-acid ligase II